MTEGTPFGVGTIHVYGIGSRMTYRTFSGAAVAILLVAGPAVAQPACEPLDANATVLSLDFLDRADPMTARVAEPIEASLLAAQIDNSAPGPLQKLYCDIGMFDMTIRFVQPVEDDAISAVVTEAIYTWDAAQDPAGWVLSAMRRQPLCARGDAPFAATCP